MLATIDVDRLPDDYGIDVALTMHALDRGLPVTQVAMPVSGAPGRRQQPPDHGRRGRRPCFDRLSPSHRSRPGADVVWPDRYWERLARRPRRPRGACKGLIEQLAPTGPSGRWRELMDRRPGDDPRSLVCTTSRRRFETPGRASRSRTLVSQLAYPFLVHAEYRRRLAVDRASAESYVVELGEQLARAICVTRRGGDADPDDRGRTAPR